MKRYLLTALVMIAMVAASSADAGAQRRNNDRVTVKASKNYILRDLGGFAPFTSIKAHGVADVEYRQAPDTRIAIFGADNALEYLEVESRGGVLEVRTRKGINFQNDPKLKVIATGPELSAVSTTGTGDIELAGDVSSTDFEMSTSGTGDITFANLSTGVLVIYGKGTGDIEGCRLECSSATMTVTGTSDIEIGNIQSSKVEISVSGTGDVEVGGRTGELVLRVRGTGDVDAGRLRAQHVDAIVSGTGDIECYAEKSLRASASGVGSITYGGNPAEVEIRGNRRSVKRR